MQKILFVVLFFLFFLSFNVLFADTGKGIEVVQKTYELWGSEMYGDDGLSEGDIREVRCDGALGEKYGVVAGVAFQSNGKGLTNIGIMCKNINFKTKEIVGVFWPSEFFEIDGAVQNFTANHLSQETDEILTGFSIKKCSWNDGLVPSVGGVKAGLFSIWGSQNKEDYSAPIKEAWEATDVSECGVLEVRECPAKTVMVGLKIWEKDIEPKGKKKKIQVKERQILDITPICQYWMPVETNFEKK